MRKAEGNIGGSAMRELPSDPARSAILCMRGNSIREDGEIPWSPVPVGDARSLVVSRGGRSAGGGPRGERRGGKPPMNDGGKSDGLVVPAKPPNNTGVPVAVAVEGRGPAEGNAASNTRPGHRAGNGASSALGRVRQKRSWTRRRGSPRCCITSTSSAFGRPIGH